ncbi:MAG: hypothetical protein D6704_10795 [Nitrospirae bacterium]|nr:MAG: hypothetical protein D6704_10795 [Nitrospirota bacterium]
MCWSQKKLAWSWNDSEQESVVLSIGSFVGMTAFWLSGILSARHGDVAPSKAPQTKPDHLMFLDRLQRKEHFG